MYYTSMKKDELKDILSNWYSEYTINSILIGRRRPKYEVIFRINEKHNVPFKAWHDIKSYLKNNTKQCTDKTSTNQEQKAS